MQQVQIVGAVNNRAESIKFSPEDKQALWESARNMHLTGPMDLDESVMMPAIDKNEDNFSPERYSVIQDSKANF